MSNNSNNYSSAIKQAIDALNHLDDSVSEGNIKSPEVVAQRMNAFVQTLQNLETMSRNMDEILNIPVPVELLEQLDKLDGNSPDLYSEKQLLDAIASKEKFTKKAKFLNDVKSILEEELEKDS